MFFWVYGYALASWEVNLESTAPWFWPWLDRKKNQNLKLLLYRYYVVYPYKEVEIGQNQGLFIKQITIIVLLIHVVAQK